MPLPPHPLLSICVYICTYVCIQQHGVMWRGGRRTVCDALLPAAPANDCCEPPAAPAVPPLVVGGCACVRACVRSSFAATRHLVRTRVPFLLRALAAYTCYLHALSGMGDDLVAHYVVQLHCGSVAVPHCVAGCPPPPKEHGGWCTATCTCAAHGCMVGAT